MVRPPSTLTRIEKHIKKEIAKSLDIEDCPKIMSLTKMCENKTKFAGV